MLATLVVLGAVSAPAVARPVAPVRTFFTFNGGGFGHGVGMPQYGAYGAARAGWDAPRILGYFYRGSQLANVQTGGAVRVAVLSGRKAITATSITEWQVVDESVTPNVARALAPGTTYRLMPDGNGVAVSTETGPPLAKFPGGIRLQAVAPNATVQIGSGTYHGATRVVTTSGRLGAVNIVDLEDYLRGVLPREMPSRWGDDAPAALEAQAVAARTYAVANLHPERPYDLESDQRSQVYGGAGGEDPRTSRAVTATSGRILVYDGRPITAFFFSSSGGRTEDGQNVFPSSQPRPYLVGVADPFDAQYSPYNRWSAPPRFSGKRLAKLLASGRPVTAITVTSRGTSGRVLGIRLFRAGGGFVDRSGADMRRALGLRDTLFTVVRTVIRPQRKA